MEAVIFYSAFAGATISVFSLTRFAVSLRHKLRGRTISEVATLEQRSLSQFRLILLLCGILFAVTLFGFIVPNTPNKLLVFVASVAIIGGELLAGIIPAHKSTVKIHEALAGIMGLGMLAFPYIFWGDLTGMFKGLEAFLAIAMTLAVILMFTDRSKKLFVTYELSFIFASHISIVLAALALR